MKPSPAGKGDHAVVDEEIAHRKAIRSPESAQPSQPLFLLNQEGTKEKAPKRKCRVRGGSAPHTPRPLFENSGAKT